MIRDAFKRMAQTEVAVTFGRYCGVGQR